MPRYYEEAARILHALATRGLPLNPHFSINFLLQWIAFELECMPSGRSHIEWGERLVDALSGGALQPAKRPRLAAIAGILVGDFLTGRANRAAQK